MIQYKAHNMPMVLVPNRIERGYLGGREIDKFRGVENPTDDNKPEAWVGSTTYTYHHRTDPSSKMGLAEVLAEGNSKAYLNDVIESAPESYLGKKHVSVFGNDTGLLVKLLDSQVQLGLQTHPDREFAKKYFNSQYGKVESWYVIGTRKDQAEKPYVLLGFKEGISREKFRRLFLDNNVLEMERCCHKIPVNPGDMFFVDAGVPHAIGPGCFMVEVQEPSDITVGARMREFKDEEEKERFIESTMGCYHYIGRHYEQNLEAYKVQPIILEQTGQSTEKLLLGRNQTSFFSVTRVDVSSSMRARETGSFSIVIVTEGAGKVIYDEGETSIRKGDELFMPAGIRNMTWQSLGGSTLSLVRCFPPEVL